MIKTATKTFVKQLAWYFKYHRQYASNETDLDLVIRDIERKVEQNFQFEIAAEYFDLEERGELSRSIFKKYRVFEKSDLHLIFVVCKECNRDLQCLQDCSNSEVKICFYDIWVG